MKTDIHPPYHPQALVTCTACGTTFKIGSTKKEIKVEVCSNCHPFYTGKSSFIDTAGRVDRFVARLKKVAEKKKQRSQKSE